MEELCYKIFNNFLQVKNAEFIVFCKKKFRFVIKKAKEPGFYQTGLFCFLENQPGFFLRSFKLKFVKIEMLNQAAVFVIKVNVEF